MTLNSIVSKIHAITLSQELETSGITNGSRMEGKMHGLDNSLGIVELASSLSAPQRKSWGDGEHRSTDTWKEFGQRHAQYGVRVNVLSGVSCYDCCSGLTDMQLGVRVKFLLGENPSCGSDASSFSETHGVEASHGATWVDVLSVECLVVFVMTPLILTGTLQNEEKDVNSSDYLPHTTCVVKLSVAPILTAGFHLEIQVSSRGLKMLQWL